MAGIRLGRGNHESVQSLYGCWRISGQQKNAPVRVALTGGIGSGKTTVATLFAEHGAPVFSADSIARELVVPGSIHLEKIAELFGPRILTRSGKLDRPALRSKIFADEEAKKALEALLHPAIRERIDQQCEQTHSPYVIIEIPLLVESNWLEIDNRETDESEPGKPHLVDRVLVVESPQKERIVRLKKRDNSSEKEILAIINTQASDMQRRQAADDVISNVGDISLLKDQVAQLHKRYLTLSTRR